MVRHRDPHERHRQKHRKHHHIARIAFAVLIIALILQAIRANNYTSAAVFGGLFAAVAALEVWLILTYH